MKGKGIIIISLLIAIMVATYYCQDLFQEQDVVQKDQKVAQIEDHISYEELLMYIDDFQSGDIINIENSNYLSSYAIPGRWKHTIIYLGTKQQVENLYDQNQVYWQTIMEQFKTGEEILVLDANSTGVKIRQLKQMANLKEESYLKALTVYRFEKDANFIDTYINKALDYIGTPYDYQMVTYDDSSLYCSELLYYALLSVDIEIKQTTTVLDYKVITPTDLIHDLKALPEVKHVMLLEKKNGQIIQTHE